MESPFTKILKNINSEIPIETKPKQRIKITKETKGKDFNGLKMKTRLVPEGVNSPDSEATQMVSTMKEVIIHILIIIF
jgi:hypothetical protein